MKAPVCLLAIMMAACAPVGDPAGSSDLAVLAEGAAEYEQARPGVPLEFPRDHGAHPGFRIEWWYLTANLQDREGRPYGAQWTLFRTATSPARRTGADNPWHDPQIYMAHLAITAPDGHRAYQRYARGGNHLGESRAGVNTRPFAAWLDDWRLASAGAGWLPMDVSARQDGYGLDLRLDSTIGPLPQGVEGYSQKHPDGGGSYYYSQPFLSASGTLQVGGEQIAVSGRAWLDREWSSQFLQPDQEGWDWFALHLDSGEKLMLFRLRPKRDSMSREAYLYGVLMAQDGTRKMLDPSRIELEELRREIVQGRRLPLHWRIDLPEIGRSLEVTALYPDQWMDLDFPYWEGVVEVSGEGAASRGRGYLEMTGYPAEQ